MRSTFLLLLIPELTFAAPRVRRGIQFRKQFVGLADGSYGKTTDSEGNEIYQSGDLIYSKKQFKHFFSNKTGDIGRSFVNPKKLWNQKIKDGRMEIAYKILDHTFDPRELQELKKVLVNVKTDFIQKTALRLVPKVERPDHDYFIQFDGRRGCTSPLGRVYREQTIYLGQGCVYQMTVQHEIMHSLGWHHEHNRADREKYIEILKDKIHPAAIHNFQIAQGSKSHGTQYEANSIMQYPRESFARRNGDVTMREKPGLRNQKLKSYREYFEESNTDRGFTDTDAYEINNVYTLKTYCESLGKKWYWLDESTGKPFKSGVGKTTPENTCVEGSSLETSTLEVKVIDDPGKRRGSFVARLMNFIRKMLGRQ